MGDSEVAVSLYYLAVDNFDCERVKSEAEVWQFKHGVKMEKAENMLDCLQKAKARSFLYVQINSDVENIFTPLLKVMRKAIYDPIIITTQHRTYSADEHIHVMENGADSYLTLQDDPSVNVELIKASIGRIKSPITQDENILIGGGVILTQTEVLYNAKPIHLTQTEHAVLQLLMERAGQVVGHKEILKTVWGEYHVYAIELLWDTIYRLRKKIPHIKTMPKKGYMFMSRL
jgi:DNA-binding response OmpR family regulator